MRDDCFRQSEYCFRFFFQISFILLVYRRLKITEHNVALL